MSERSNRLADRLEQGARSLADFANGLSDAHWKTRMSDARTVGVTVHHVASVYPIEIEIAQMIAGGKPMTGVTWDVVHTMNAGHAAENKAVTKEAALALLKKNSAAAAAAIRAMSDAELDRAAPASLYSDASVTAQFVLEDHAVRHAFHHHAQLRRVLKMDPVTA